MSELDAQSDVTEDLYPEILSDAEAIGEDIDELEADPNAAQMSSSSEDEPQDVMFLVPKLNSTASKVLTLISTATWTKFRREVASIMGESRDTLSVAYRLSSSPATAPFATLDTPDEYYEMIKKYLNALGNSSKGKKGQLDIKIKSQVEPTKVPAKTLKTPKNEEVDGRLSEWKIMKRLRDEHTKCVGSDHPNQPCWVSNDGVHHHLNPEMLATWVALIAHHDATFQTPPGQIKIGDRAPPPRGTASKTAQPFVAAPQPPPTQNLFSDPVAIAAMIAAITAGIGRPVAPALPAPVDHSDLDAKLTFPTIKSWLTSIIDVQPSLTKYADALELNGIKYLNHLDNLDLTIPILQEMTEMDFVEASALLRMGKKICQEFREMSK
ncbi:hypothetical protein BDV93DRAFT_516170 [Ceratobasidium sp. AG-I]|nr:hypothetical protein BDV93DRAFT_516170 [Ceratobasidium sp. AG-I]